MSVSDLFPPPPPAMPLPDPVMVALYGGAATFGCIVAGLFFLKFWRRTREGLFLAFALAFWLLAANSALPVLLNRPAQMHGEVYLLRLLAFLLIIGAIVAKNLQGRPRSSRPPGR